MKRSSVTDEAIERAIAGGAKVLGVKLPGAEGKPRRSKYNAKPTVYNGVRYDSKAEAARAAELDYRLSTGFALWWIGQPKFRLGCPENVYVADFLVGMQTPDGVEVHAEDVKGVRTPKFARDIKLWRHYGPFSLWVIGKTIEIIRPGDPVEE
jgi:hypothetical protein